MKEDDGKISKKIERNRVTAFEFWRIEAIGYCLGTEVTDPYSKNRGRGILRTRTRRSSPSRWRLCSMEYVTTAEQVADIFTKALDPILFIKFSDRLVVSRATLNIIEKIEKRKVPAAAAEEEEEEPDKKKKRS